MLVLRDMAWLTGQHPHQGFQLWIPELPYISGRELSGEVAQVPENDSQWRVGDRVNIHLSTNPVLFQAANTDRPR